MSEMFAVVDRSSEQQADRARAAGLFHADATPIRHQDHRRAGSDCRDDGRTATQHSGHGVDGSVDLREGLGRDAQKVYVDATSPGAVFEDLIVLGTRVGEGIVSSPGHIRAYDVKSGKQRWIFHTIPHPGEYG